MNLKKAELLLKRRIEELSKKHAVPSVESVTVSEDEDSDLVVVFSEPITAAFTDLLKQIECDVVTQAGSIVFLAVPVQWIATPSRSPWADIDPRARLTNALFDAGITDWVRIRLTEDNAALEVEFLEHPTAEQIAGLKVGYDVLTFDELVYTFVERTSGTEPQAEATPLVDPAKVEAKVRQCWAGGHGGKITALEAQTDPREFIITTVKPVPLNANLRNHGLALVKQIAPEITHVRVMDELWAKLLGTHTPVSTTVVFTATISDGDTERINPSDVECSADLLLQFYIENTTDEMSVNLNFPSMVAQYNALVDAGLLERVGDAVDLNTSKWQDYGITPEGRMFAAAMMDVGISIVDFLHEPDAEESGPDLDDRELEIEDLRRQVSELQHIIKTLTPVSNEWQTLRLVVERDPSITKHPKIAEQEALGWKVNHTQFATNGQDVLFVLMERTPQAATTPRYTSAYATAGTLSSNGRIERAIMQGSGRLEQIMIRDMNAEIEPTMNALATAFGVNPEAWR